MKDRRVKDLWKNKTVEEFDDDCGAFKRYAELRKEGVKGVCMMPFDDKFILLYEECSLTSSQPA